jgi:N-acetyl-anhydromuramyl-L-alanine amidase AmpD
MGEPEVRKITEIIVHCSATRPDWMERFPIAKKVEEIRAWHTRDRGWRDIGYHYLIDRNGAVATGRPVEQIGAHVQGRNTGTIGVCLIGGHGSSETDKFSQHFTAQQDAALRSLLADLRKRHGNVPVTGHNQYAAKACPGFNVPTWLAGKTPTHKPITPETVENPNQPDHWITAVIAFFAWLAGMFKKSP